MLSTVPILPSVISVPILPSVISLYGIFNVLVSNSSCELSNLYHPNLGTIML